MSSPIITSTDQLLADFNAAETPVTDFRIGAEAEKFGVHSETGAPLGYEGEHGVLRVFKALEKHGWQPGSEYAGGPTISLKRDGASVTLEPGAQLELSGAPQPDVHTICGELESHLHELEEISAEMGVCWLGVGFHPFARQEDLSWVPKKRYAIMREYLPTRGSRALDMMRRTATVQANFDFENEEDALRKLMVSVRLGPLINALAANSPFLEGRLGPHKSERGDVWLNMDPARSGVMPALWSLEKPTYRDYAEWALEAGMFFFERDGELVRNSGQSFRSFLSEGYQGHKATLADWRFHLNTLFPEARLKQTLEVRSVDALPTRLTVAIPALYTGILYDPASLAQAEELSRRFSLQQLEAARKDLVTRALDASIGPHSVRGLAEELLDISKAGLVRRARKDSQGRDESRFLEPLIELVGRGRVPADELTAGLDASTSQAELTRAILQRARV